MRHIRHSAIGLCAFLTSTALASPLYAQSIQPAYRNFDANGVDLVQGDFRYMLEEASIGSGRATLSLVRLNNENAFTQWDQITFTQTNVSGVLRTAIGMPGGAFEIFNGSTNTKANGATLSATANGYDYQAADGTKISFIHPQASPVGSNWCEGGGPYPCSLLPETITYPDGRIITLSFGWLSSGGGPNDLRTYVWRLNSISNSFGYSIVFNYQNPVAIYPPPAGWYVRSSANLKNNGTTRATVSYAYPTVGTTDITTPGNRVWRVTATSIRRPGEATPFLQASGTTNVTSVTNNGVTTSYNRVVSSGTSTMTVTDPLGQQTVVISDLSIGRPTSVKDPLNRTTSFAHDNFGRLTRLTEPEGNYTDLTFDARGNVTTATAVAKSGSGLANIVTSATFPSACTNPLTCNRPTATTDALGKVTDYTYNAVHGGVESVARPAAEAGGVRPQTRYTYSLLNGENLLTGISTCQTQASCTGAADEVKTTLGYDSNGNIINIATGNGTGTLTASQAMTYDTVGNLLTVDGPLAGTADTTRIRYNAARETTGIISPDPDGAGLLKHRAVRNTYTNVLLTKVEIGTVNSQSNPDWANFAPAEAIEVTYDANARVTKNKLASGGTAYALTQQNYDALGRTDCTATRMNPAVYGSLPASTCALSTQGTAGPDRITKIVYDAAGQVTQNRVAVGTAEEAAERTLTYTGNGRLATLTDAEVNKTTYEYDGHDRLSKTRFPLPAKGSNASSTTDYEQLTYDPASNVTSRRLRDATSIAFTYDNLNRPTLKNLPGSEPDVTYAYDLLDRLTASSQTGHALSFTYDALSRNLTQTGPLGTVSSTWDLAGRRTRLTWPDAFFVDYEYLVTGETTRIRENGAASGIGVLATYSYDNLGRRTGAAFGNGTSTAYGFDPVSRLASLAVTAPATPYSLTVGPIAYNPASQIVSQVRSNDSFAWTGHGSGTTASTANGLNQLATIGGAATAHDARGNLTLDPSTGRTYGYSSENLLTSASGGVSFAYDPLLRLYSGSSGYRFAYDGLDLVAEYNSGGAMVFRHVFGPGVDEPVVSYVGSGTDRRFLAADERGSIVLMTDNAGTAWQVNQYDEFGKPGASNSGRFQYTGQVWLPEIGVQYSKARMYAPHLGRFMQADPIGYWDSANLYAYVLNDPVNWVDPLGLCAYNQVFIQTGGGTSTDERGDPVISASGYCGYMPGTVPRTLVNYRPGAGDGPSPTPQKEEPEESTVDKAKRCASAQLGLDDLAAAGAAVSGFNILETRGKFAGATPGTSIASRGASAVFGQTRLPFRVPTIVGNPLRLSAGIRATSSVARIVGRGIPVVGWGLLAYDAAKIAQCVASDD